MINPEIRFTGILLRKLIRFSGKKSFYRIGKLKSFTERFVKIKNMQCSEQTIQTPDNKNLKLFICKPLNPKPNATGLLWIHGGGYAMGSPLQDNEYIQNFIDAANCIVVSPDYRLSINEPYPAAVNDCYNALLWMKEQASVLGIRENQLFVGGNSAGGGLTAAVTLMAREKKDVRIAFQMPFYPMIDDRTDLKPELENDGPVWNSKANKAAWSLYLDSLYGTEGIPVFAAPARETNFSGLPPAYSFIGDIDLFCEETKHYFKNLKAAGIKAELDVYPGCFHAFDYFCSKTKIGKIAIHKYLEKFKYAAENYFSD